LKVDRYDRQIRLWGARGQRKLGTSKVALLKCSGGGIEALKNLVLPGIGSIDIWDDELIKVEDLSESFFYEHESVGSPKA
jgi:amyloid beta precursor protein binding protein 1